MIAKQTIAKCGTSLVGELSMADAESIDRTLGRLLEITESQSRELSNIKQDGSETRNMVAGVSGQLSSLHTSNVLMQAKIDAAHARLDKAEPKVEKHETIISRMIWLGSIIVAGITLVINWASPFLAKLWP
jgi:chromosome segregation ATPase